MGSEGRARGREGRRAGGGKKKEGLISKRGRCWRRSEATGGAEEEIMRGEGRVEEKREEARCAAGRDEGRRRREGGRHRWSD